MTTVSALTLAGSHVNILGVHPELRNIARVTLADGELNDSGVWVTSGARTRAKQLGLYQSYKAGKGPLAANPDYRNPSTGRRGSAHQVQMAGEYRSGKLDNSAPWAYAIDISFKSRTDRPWDRLRELMTDNGAIANLWHKGETWHYVVQTAWAPIVVAGHGSKGSTVARLQAQWAAAGSDVKPDGQYGPKTAKVAASWQRKLGSKGIGIHGDWTERDQRRFDRSTIQKKQPAIVNGDGDQLELYREALRRVRAISRRALS